MRNSDQFEGGVGGERFDRREILQRGVALADVSSLAFDARVRVVALLEEICFVGIDLGSLRRGGAMQQLGGPLSALNLHFVGGSDE